MRYTRRRSKFSYQQYYFQVIMPDLKKIFFSLTNPALYTVFQAYKRNYGESAYNYALKSFPDWRNGTKAISTQTMYRLLETLPSVLSTKQRTHLLEKIINRYVATHPTNTSQDYKSYSLTWDNYKSELNSLIIILQRKLNTSNPVLYTTLPKVIVDSATWVCDDDMLIVQRILNDCYATKVRYRYIAAINDVKAFWNRCNSLKANNNVYGRVSLDLNIPDTVYYINIVPKEKTFSQKLSEFFGGL